MSGDNSSTLDIFEQELRDLIADDDRERAHLKSDLLLTRLVANIVAMDSAADVDKAQVQRIINLYEGACENRWWYA